MRVRTHPHQCRCASSSSIFAPSSKNFARNRVFVFLEGLRRALRRIADPTTMASRAEITGRRGTDTTVTAKRSVKSVANNSIEVDPSVSDEIEPFAPVEGGGGFILAQPVARGPPEAREARLFNRRILHSARDQRSFLFRTSEDRQRPEGDAGRYPPPDLNRSRGPLARGDVGHRLVDQEHSFPVPGAFAHHARSGFYQKRCAKKRRGPTAPTPRTSATTIGAIYVGRRYII